MHFDNKNLEYRYVTIKIHLTISNFKKVCLKMALSYVSTESREAPAVEHSITWVQPPRMTYGLVWP